MTFVEEVHAGDSYLSHSDWRLHFGLGAAKIVDEMTIRWPTGEVQKVTKVEVDRVMSVKE
jgi:hypothetical protein